jgi:hypothetical protein
MEKPSRGEQVVRTHLEPAPCPGGTQALVLKGAAHVGGLRAPQDLQGR